MKKSKVAQLFIISLFFVTFLSHANAQNSTDQNADAQSYSVYTYVIIGSKDNSEKSSVSTEISKTLEGVKREFDFTNVQVVLTQFQNIKLGGKTDYRTIIKGQKSSVGAERPVFTELVLQGFYTPDVIDRASYGFSSFRFSARFPYVSETLSANKEITEVVNYESIVINSKDVDITPDKPTLISSLPVGDQAFFFVVKIKSNR